MHIRPPRSERDTPPFRSLRYRLRAGTAARRRAAAQPLSSLWLEPGVVAAHPRKMTDGLASSPLMHHEL